MSLARASRLAVVLGLASASAVAAAGLSACSSNAPGEITADSDDQVSGTQAVEGDKPQGIAPADGQFRALMVLNLTNEAGLRSLVDAMYTPGSATFRKYLSVASFEATYSPSQANLSTVTSWVKSNGMTVNRTAANRMLVELSGTVSQFENAFGVTLFFNYRWCS